MQDRDVYLRIWRELAGDKSMVFVAGPRQSGKTTLSKIISSRYANSVYFNWDIREQRLKLLEKENGQLKKIVADLTLDNQILKEVAEGNF